ncbi:PA14 domain-containing protein [Streptomyces sp. NPDC057445]|uniref:PA14 domain-containing protein n=1 Tax=Streptomyces sp. NPDC057445 TaxID=3346136 RepID=UPI0036C1FF68
MHHRFRAVCAAAAAVGAAAAGLALPATARAATVSCADGVWKAAYHANTTLTGTPRLTTCDAAVSENYGTGAPAGATLPKDNFSVRWTTTRDFGSGGPFVLTATMQDGIRVYVDGVRRIDAWRNVSTTQKRTVDVSVPQGRHTLRVDFAAWTGNANVAFAYTPRTTAAVDKVAPLAPGGLRASYANERTALSWTRSKEMDLAGYRVLRRVGSSGTWTRIGTPTTTSYTDSPPATGAAYQYVVRAVDKAGNESPGSAARSVTSTDRTPPAAPTGLTVSDGPPGIALAWKPATGAARYYVYRASRIMDDDSALVHRKVATVTSTSWTDTTAREQLSHNYRVAAVDAAGNVSSRSTAREVTRGNHPPLPPLGLRATPVPGTGIVLKWNASDSEDLRRYKVYRNGRVVEDDARTTTFTDPYVRHGKTYDYAVTAVDYSGNESVRSGTASAVAPPDDLAPAPVTGLKATPQAEGVAVEWRPNEGDGTQKYRVYRGKYAAGTWDYHLVEEVGRYDLFHFDEATANGETVRYAVVAVDESGNSRFDNGEAFSYVTVTEVDLWTPTEPTPPGAPLQLTAQTINSWQTDLTWSCHAEDCEGATGFHVYRWDGDNGSYDRLTDEPLSATDRFYADTNTPWGVAHHYRVTAVHADGTESAPAAATDAGDDG